jgi:Flp pilus assembly protein TadG
MRTQAVPLKHRKQRGQTLVLVALCLVVLISMAALAIDLTTLYVARGEMQRSADAAALAGAQAFVSSGTTTDPGNGNLQLLATILANSYVNGVTARNLVGGVPPVPTTSFDFTTHPGNPQITVTMQRTDVPTFFARIFGQRLATVSATAIAEAYNSSNTTGASGSMPPVAPTCTKPWLVVNLDPDHGGATPQSFVNPDGSLTNRGVWANPGGGIIAEPITLSDIWQSPLPAAPLTTPGYLPANLPNAPGGTCPSCSGGGGNFAESVACCDTANAAQYSCGANPSTLTVDTNSDRAGSLAGAACLLTGAGGSGPTPGGNDILDPINFQTSGGVDPMQIQSGTAPHSGEVVTTSGQIVTLPIIATNVGGATVNVVGFMQAFVQSTSDTGLHPGAITMYVLNISGCGTNINTGAAPVSGGGVSAVPVRLIHP